MKAKYAAVIAVVLIAATLAVTLGGGFGGDRVAAQSAPDGPDAVTNGTNDPSDEAVSEADPEKKDKKVRLTIEALGIPAMEKLPGARVRIREISGTAPGRYAFTKGDPRKVLGTLVTGVTDGQGRFTAKVPATAVLSVEVAPPPGAWYLHDTPPLGPGFNCKDACVEVVLQDGNIMWRANGNQGTYREANASEKAIYDPLVFTFRCV